MSSRELVDELHRRQAEMYAGGSTESVVELLTEDVVWHVPGASPIAGDEGSRIAEVWLVPLDLQKFDRVWGASGRS